MPDLDRAAQLEGLRNCLRNLEETIGSLVELMLSLPEGPIREQLLEEVSCLDSIADVMRKAMEEDG